MSFLELDLPESVKRDVLTKDIAFFSELDSLAQIRSKDSVKSVIFLFCEKGRIQFMINGQRQTLTKGQMVVCRPDVFYDNYKLTANFVCKVIALSYDFLLSLITNNRIKWSNFYKRTAEPPIISLDADMIRLFVQYEKLIITRKKMFRGKSFEDVVTHLTLALLADFSCYVQKTGSCEPEDVMTHVRQSDVIFKNFLGLLRESVGGEGVPARSIQYYADKLNVSAKYLTHISKCCCGETAKSLIDKALANRIQTLLLHSDLSVKEISVKLGFPDVSNFGRYVKVQTGHSPRAIRISAGK